ncbi:Chitinase 1 [Candida maltosa Xu316]|uniref:chitinase n=1 Tax=Candida maltosa (strain Xu316) TaxID=1245528 RepID=M3JUB5_CANMX|nr:Chitinase 1 [Candida maltosa Xu316]
MILKVFITFLLAVTATASNIAVYWGQNAGGNQQSLSYYCSNTPAQIIILSFLNDFPNMNLNFANQPLSIGPDIKSCQAQGKIILLSLGGESGSYGFTSDSQATQFASTLWSTFGEGTGSSNRPFGDAVVDGFDFDIENKDQTGYAALATQLRKYFSTGSKPYYLSAAPQCPYPDASVGDLMSQVDLDFAFIQFYNNYCSLDKQFNWNTWSSYAAGKNIKLYLGLPGSSSSAGSGFVGISTIQSALASIKSSPNFGGISLWDVSSAENGGFLNQINNALSGSGGSVAQSSAIPPSVSSAAPIGSSAPIYVSNTAATPTTSTGNNLFDWIDGLFGGQETSTAQQQPVASAPPPAITPQPSLATQPAVTAQPTQPAVTVQQPSSSSAFNWFGSTSTNTLRDAYQDNIPRSISNLNCQEKRCHC